ncbi:MAG: hypothetical protein QM778_13545 [Myxococcales bacterium]
MKSRLFAPGLGLTALWIALSGCTVDSKTNKLYRGGKCPAGQHNYKGFCLPDETGSMDGGMGDPCDHEGDQKLCYDGDLATSRQLPCMSGISTCTHGFWSTCVGQVLPKPKEECNGADDDCDSQIDEEVGGSECDSGVPGECATGIQYCSGGKAHCRALADKQPEMCNANPELVQDLDCDGLAGDQDPDLQAPCYESNDLGCTKQADGSFSCRGICQPGVKGCSGVCMNAVYAGEEERTPRVDGGLAEIKNEDCDDQFDEGFPCDDGQYACSTIPAANQGKGICKPGRRTCSGGVLSACEDEIKPEPETCANLGFDNDCNGKLDDIPLRGQLCGSSGALGECGEEAVWDCEGTELKCKAAAEMAEICGDEKDNDCDGETDTRCGSASNKCCGPACVNTKQSNLHCGDCNHKCEGATSCCDSNCVDMTTDPLNCGVCGKRCTVLNLGILIMTTCMNSVCQGL